MKSTRYIVKLFATILIIGLLPFITSCAGEVGPVYRTWIDFPKQGAEFSPGSTIPITFHVTKSEGMSEVIIRVNGEIIHKAPPPPDGDPVLAINQEWIPDLPGDYTIEVDVTDNDGITMSRAQVDIHVVGELEALKPDLAITDIQLVGNNQIKCYYGNFGAAVLPEGRDFWLDIILGPAESEVPPVLRVNLGSASTILIYGTSYYVPYTLTTVPSWPHLVTCRIDVDGQINESDEDNNMMMLNLGVNLAAPPIATTVTPTDPPPTTQPPPPTTQPPPPPPTDTPIPDTTPPNISGMSAVPDRIAALPCAQNTVTVSAQVTDPSGVSQVKLYYRATKGGIVGSWQVENMTHTGGNGYQIVVGPSQISASYSPYGGLILQYYVKAWDSHDNAGQTPSGNVPLDYCVQ